MVHVELIVLTLVAVSFAAAKSSLNDSPDPKILISNADKYTAKVQLQGCLKELIAHPTKEFLEVVQKAHEMIKDTKTEFCKQTFESALPIGCFFTKECQKIGKPEPLTVDAIFALYYGIKQLQHNHPGWFSCKDEQGKEKLGQIIKPEGYTPGYDLANGILSHPLFECPT